MRVSDFKLLESTNIIDMTTYSSSFQLEHLYGFSIAITFTGDSNFTGAFILQASNDDLNWADIDTHSSSGTGGTCIFNVTDVFYKHVRLKISKTTGTILTLTAQVYGKGV